MNEACAACGMAVSGPAYHPYLACLAFQHSRSGVMVEANLRAVVEYGMRAAAAGASLDHAMEDIRWDSVTRPDAKPSSTKAKSKSKRGPR